MDGNGCAHYSGHVAAQNRICFVSKALEILNTAPREAALGLLKPLVERSTWVAEQAVDQRPFASEQDVAQNLVNAILEAKFDRRVSLFCAHPELAGREASAGTMTDASTREQDRLGLLQLSPHNARRLRDMNARYAARFGHPYIVALHRVPDVDTLFETFERRLAASPVEEHVATLAEIASVIDARAANAFGPDARSAHEARTPSEADNV